MTAIPASQVLMMFGALVNVDPRTLAVASSSWAN